MGALKDNVDDGLVTDLAAELAHAWPPFPTDRFVTEATDGLAQLELKARLRHVAGALRRAIGDEPSHVVEVLDAALASPSFEGWMVWSCTELVASLAPAAPETVVPFLARLTPRSTCEFAIRPYLDAHPELTWEHLHRWVDHPDEHVRRLVSEGTRPRLPWGARLRELQADPRPSIVLLDRLRDDPSPYVRRSVANHLGDIVKDHRELALETAERWCSAGGDHVDEVVRHGLRTLVKSGEPRALALLGYDAEAAVTLVGFEVSPASIAIGDHVTVTVELTTDATAPVPVVIEYRIHYLGARGPRTPKAYRLAERILEPGVVASLRRRQRFVHASIRTLYPGEQLVEVQVNGRVLGSRTVVLDDA